VSRAAGVTQEQLLELAEYETSAAFTDEQRLVLRLADAMSTTPANISDDLFKALRARFDEAQLVELSGSIAWEHFRARYNRVFDIQSDEFSEGAFCAMPVRPAKVG